MIYYVYLTMINAILVIGLVLVQAPSQEENYDPSVARLAVQQKISSLAGLDSNAISFRETCSESNSYGGRISGQGEAITTKSIQKKHQYSKSTQFSYEVDVNARCFKLNPHCYNISDMVITGETRFVPKL